MEETARRVLEAYILDSKHRIEQINEAIEGFQAQIARLMRERTNLRQDVDQLQKLLDESS